MFDKYLAESAFHVLKQVNIISCDKYISVEDRIRLRQALDGKCPMLKKRGVLNLVYRTHVFYVSTCDLM